MTYLKVGIVWNAFRQNNKAVVLIKDSKVLLAAKFKALQMKDRLH